MAALVSALVIMQAVGAIIGAGGSILGELFYISAIQDGRIDHAERNHLRIVGRTLGFGMILLLLSNLGLVVLAYTHNFSPQPALTPTYWTLMALSVVNIWSVWAIARKQISFTLGSALIFTAWWYIAFLTLGKMPLTTFGASVVIYVIFTAVIAGILSYARMMVLKSHT